MTTRVVGVRFKKAGKIYYFDAKDHEINPDDHVIVETVQGMEYGDVALTPREIDETQMKNPIKPIIRVATGEDDDRYSEIKKLEEESRIIFEEKVIENGLDMKLINAEYTFDQKKAIFYFTAEGRVDFRKLVKDLASVFHVRIELRQIGVRDEVKLMHTLGICGRNTCCSEWLGDFTPVSIKMAKEQGLSLNSTKISGVCGRLLCCLTFEDDFYRSITKKMPKIGNWVTTPDGEGQVYRLNVLEEKVLVRLVMPGDEMEIRSYDVDEVVRSGEKHAQANNLRQKQRNQERKQEQAADAAGQLTDDGERPAQQAKNHRGKKRQNGRTAEGHPDNHANRNKRSHTGGENGAASHKEGGDKSKDDKNRKRGGKRYRPNRSKSGKRSGKPRQQAKNKE
ncbi:MAG: stage 0 sporulation protein [Eubacteriaceae bacterium]|nr:stage 0 sporulation protein [Eubacteriaceae bacterium]